MSDNTLQRAERLRSLKAIRHLFSEGRSGFVYPFRYMFYVEKVIENGAESAENLTTGVKIMFSVPKKFHKRANKRNLLKRRTREAYRLNREQLRNMIGDKAVNLDLALVYSTKEILSYKTIENAVQRILGQICERL